MVLAIGLVVDDAIIVVENVDRHISEGKNRLDAALMAARELGIPILAMSITLVAVFLPIGFMSGLTGALFKEFAFTLAGDVIISGIVALTLSPMLSSRFLKQETEKKGFVHFLDKQFNAIRELYARILDKVLDSKPVVVFVIIVVLTSAYFLFITSKSELAPTEDQGAIFVQGTGAPTATLNDLQNSAKQIGQIYKTIPELQQYFMALGFGSSNNALISGFMLKPWNERKKTQMEIMPYLQQKLNTVPGLQIVAFPLPSLPGSQGLPVQFVITTTSSYQQLYQVANELIAKAMKSGLFAYMDSDLKYDQPQINIKIDRLNRFNQQNSATISATIKPGVTLGQALDYLENLSNKIFPRGFTYNFSGQSRQFVQEGSSMLITFFFALVIIYLVLAALFESFVDPLVVLISVPMSITGALIFLSLGFATVNIYTEVGLVTLIGLVSKHGILIVKFANDLQDQGVKKLDAIRQAAQIRLRPILMTTAAMVFGVVPLLLATGAGAVSRFDIGLVIASGLGIGTFLTIFIVPCVYLLIGKDKSKAK